MVHYSYSYLKNYNNIKFIYVTILNRENTNEFVPSPLGIVKLGKIIVRGIYVGKTM